MLPRRHEWMLARRYLRSRRDERFVSLIGWSSAIGVAIGVGALIVVLSVMYGFDRELKDRILGFSSHVDIQGAGDAIRDWREWLAIARGLPGVERAAPYISGQVLASVGHRATGAILKGVDPRHGDAVAAHVSEGRFLDPEHSPFEVVVGKDLARKLGIVPGERLRLLSPSSGVSPAGAAPRMRAFRVVGIFDSGFYEYDVGLIVTTLEAMQRLNRMGDAVTGIELFLHDRDQAAAVANRARI
ncbi:MAG: ABC transporter permease, partial [Mariprofundaceae bacterium]